MATALTPVERQLVDLGDRGSDIPSQLWPCRYNLAGVCRYGSKCKFLHCSKTDLPRCPQQLADKQCSLRNCPYMHFKPPTETSGWLRTAMKRFATRQRAGDHDARHPAGFDDAEVVHSGDSSDDEAAHNHLGAAGWDGWPTSHEDVHVSPFHSPAAAAAAAPTAPSAPAPRQDDVYDALLANVLALYAVDMDVAHRVVDVMLRTHSERLVHLVRGPAQQLQAALDVAYAQQADIDGSTAPGAAPVPPPPPPPAFGIVPTPPPPPPAAAAAPPAAGRPPARRPNLFAFERTPTREPAGAAASLFASQPAPPSQPAASSSSSRRGTSDDPHTAQFDPFDPFAPGDAPFAPGPAVDGPFGFLFADAEAPAVGVAQATATAATTATTDADVCANAFAAPNADRPPCARCGAHVAAHELPAHERACSVFGEARPAAADPFSVFAAAGAVPTAERDRLALQLRRERERAEAATKRADALQQQVATLQQAAAQAAARLEQSERERAALQQSRAQAAAQAAARLEQSERERAGLQRQLLEARRAQEQQAARLRAVSQQRAQEARKHYECCICMEENKAFAALRPCGHVVCTDCAPTLRACPHCSKPFEGTTPVFL